MQQFDFSSCLKSMKNLFLTLSIMCFVLFASAYNQSNTSTIETIRTMEIYTDSSDTTTLKTSEKDTIDLSIDMITFKTPFKWTSCCWGGSTNSNDSGYSYISGEVITTIKYIEGPEPTLKMDHFNVVDQLKFYVQGFSSIGSVWTINDKYGKTVARGYLDNVASADHSIDVSFLARGRYTLVIGQGFNQEDATFTKL
ncbi:MAG: hypothetical protein R2852_08920 [Bacteroidia bacterium]